MDLDSETFAARWNQGSVGTGAVLGFKVESCDEVDSLVAALAADGVPSSSRLRRLLGGPLCRRQRPRWPRRGDHEPDRPGGRRTSPRPVSDPGPGVVDVVIEIPTGSRNKYEYDHEKHVIRWMRRLFTATTYPADYGFVPDTLAGDGDPLDDWCSWRFPPSRAASCGRASSAVLHERREGRGGGPICVLEHDPQWDDAHDINDVPEHLRNEIAHFFSIYKDLEPEKSVEVQGFAGRARALDELELCRIAYRAGAT